MNGLNQLLRLQKWTLDEKRRHLIIPIEAGYGASEFIVDLPPAS